MKNSVWTILLFVSVSGGACVAQSEPTSLADVAKQQKSDKKATLVLSDDDKPASFSSGSDATSTDSNQTKDDTSNADQKSSDTKAKDSKLSSKKDEGTSKDNLKKQLDSYKAEKDTWQASAKRYEEQLATETDDFRRQMDQEALDNDKKNVAYYQHKIDEAQAALNNAQKSSGSQSNANTSAPGSQ